MNWHVATLIALLILPASSFAAEAPSQQALSTMARSLGGNDLKLLTSAEHECVRHVIDCNETRSSEITPFDCTDDAGTYYDIWFFNAFVGQLVTFEVLSEEMDSYIIVLDSNTELVAQDDDSGGGLNARVQVTTNLAGEWAIGASGRPGGFEFGDYRVRVSCAGGGGVATPSNLQASALSGSEVALSWVDNSNNETTFEIERRQGSGSYLLIGSVAAGTTNTVVSGLAPLTTYTFRVRGVNGASASQFSNEATATTSAGSGGCSPGADTLCLNKGRFEVQATYRTKAGQEGTAQVVKLTDETGYLWFFNSANVEAVVKILDACALNGNFWVFAGGLTNVEVTLTVTDTETGNSKTYTNPQGKAFQPIQDTTALSCN
jgi:hypothetical protein